jgi:putative spermidine/putrescine transport system substrate-binding protein
VRADTMAAKGTIDKAAYKVLPPVDGAATFVSVEQNNAATKYLQANWTKAVG